MSVRRPWLGEMAREEHTSRVRRYPALVEEGRLERGDAEADIAAWDAIATLFTEGEVETPIGWAEMELAATRALQSVSAAAEAKPDDERLRARRTAIDGIHDRLAWHRRNTCPRPLGELYAQAAQGRQVT
jgi:hypothetical protein